MMSLWRNTILAIGATMFVVVSGLVLASPYFDAFLVEDGMGWRPGSVYRYRRCLGMTWEPHDVRDGADVRCLGVPVGPWHCYALADDAPPVRIPCSP